MRKVLKIDNVGLFIEDILIEDTESTPIDCIEVECESGFYLPKWNGTKWVEGMSQSEILEGIKSAKIKELNIACTNAILEGFEYTQNNNTYLLGFDEQDQSNLTQIMAIVSIVSEPITWKVKGELIFLQFTRDEFLQMGLVAKQHKEGKMQRYYQLCGQVQACTDVAGVDVIVW